MTQASYTKRLREFLDPLYRIRGMMTYYYSTEDLDRSDWDLTVHRVLCFCIETDGMIIYEGIPTPHPPHKSRLKP
jgi:hypothetical protein